VVEEVSEWAVLPRMGAAPERLSVRCAVVGRACRVNDCGVSLQQVLRSATHASDGIIDQYTFPRLALLLPNIESLRAVRLGFSFSSRSAEIKRRQLTLVFARRIFVPLSVVTTAASVTLFMEAGLKVSWLLAEQIS
jgi:hypothetical protein